MDTRTCDNTLEKVGNLVVSVKLNDHTQDVDCICHDFDITALGDLHQVRHNLGKVLGQSSLSNKQELANDTEDGLSRLVLLRGGELLLELLDDLGDLA